MRGGNKAFDCHLANFKALTNVGKLQSFIKCYKKGCALLWLGTLNEALPSSGLRTGFPALQASAGV